MLQIGRNVTDSQAGALQGKRYLIIDRDTRYSDQSLGRARYGVLWPNTYLIITQNEIIKGSKTD